jgi:ribosomal protein S18 acetylase RimI-like enzyme
VQVRRLEPPEWVAFRDIRLRALADAPEAFGGTLAGESAQSDADWQAKADPKGGAIFVVDGADGLVAMVMGGQAPTDFPGAAALFSMWVDPSIRRSGLGIALIDAVKAWAIEQGYSVLGLGVTTTNEPAIALYRRLGFADTGDRYPLRKDRDLTIQIMALGLT